MYHSEVFWCLPLSVLASQWLWTVPAVSSVEMRSALQPDNKQRLFTTQHKFHIPTQNDTEQQLFCSSFPTNEYVCLYCIICGGAHVSCCISIMVNIAWWPVTAAPPSVVWFLLELWRFPCSLSAGCPAPPEGTHRRDKRTRVRTTNRTLYF